MLNNDTPASATGGAGIKKQVLFGPQSVSNTSGTFTVGPEPFYIRAFNLNVGDTITVQAVGGTGSGTAFATYAPLGSPIVLNQSTPQVRLDWPGQYRLVFSGVSVTSILCEGFLAASSEPTIYTQGVGGGGGGGFNLVASDTQSIDLNFVGTSAGGTLTANAKISAAANNLLQSTLGGLYTTTLINVSGNLTISGNGSTGTPYIIGANLSVLPFPDLTIPVADGLVSGPALSIVLYCVESPFEHCDVYGGERSANSLGETCVGFASGSVAGGFKVAVGHSAMSGATTASAGGFVFDIAIGRQAMTSAVRNTTLSTAAVAVGPNAGDSMQYSQAVVIGSQAGRNTNSLSIVAVGVQAGDGSIGDANTFLGNTSGGSGRTTSSSVYVGDQAGSGAAAAAGAVMIGANAGLIATNSKDNCIYIGANAGHLDSFTNCIIIGSSTVGNVNATANNQIILGTASHTQLRTAGSIIAGGAISPSDARLKDNVVTIGNALEIVDKLRPVYFHWDQQALENAKLPHRAVDCGKNTSGFIAQELNEIIPEVVDVMMGGDGVAYNYVHYDRLIGLAFAAVKELSTQNKALIARIEALEAKGS